MWMLKTAGGGLTYQGPQGNELHNLQSLVIFFSLLRRIKVDNHRNVKAKKLDQDTLCFDGRNKQESSKVNMG